MEMTNFKILVWLYQNLGNIEPARPPEFCFLILARAEVPVSALGTGALILPYLRVPTEIVVVRVPKSAFLTY